ncbi:helix-turn-helix transcriptional regulator [Nocardia huaxiensis]|uniref:Helix-turn-helix domain-containing protein n=1 Tax=Nocardia huaxiensis TaxID=2755382 RepID=A0A7D6V8M4_9NOCA|nr:LuxR family transcriptional regulator [Nocardia huaxiensis]QLY29013.1 helix-turn-helix domain-containing protein [Nocardia huaxiensis]UFS97504.1 LuxR family transcriptional regulator [Nocardia huaxiensis]
MLFGREAEIEVISSFVVDGCGGETALVLSGEPGVGKTALLDAAAEIAAARGVRVLRAAALEFEAELSFGALNQLLQPLSGHIEVLEAAHREALRVVMGSETGAMPTQLVAGAATLALLRAAAQAGALLLIVDDVQWLDLASSMAVIYALRRLGPADVRLLAATRTEAGDAFTRSGFRLHEVAPLDAGSAEKLLSAAFPALSTAVRGRLRSDARGNPLALLELPAALRTLHGTAQLPGVLPLTRRLQGMFADRLDALPAATRRTLLFVVLAGAENSTTIEECVRTPEGRDALLPAERAGLIRPNPRTGRLEFRHPLLRSAVVESSTSEERRGAHRILADAFAASPQRRAWHLGQAATGPDEDVAAQLETLSQLMVRDGDAGRAAAAMLRAAELSPADGDRARRTARAAYLGSLLTGDLADSGRLLRAAPNPALGGRSLPVALAASFQLLNSEGDVTTASRLLLAGLHAAAEEESRDQDTVIEALHTLLSIGFYSGPDGPWTEIDAALERVVVEPEDTLALLRGPFVDPVHSGPKALADLDSALDGLRLSADPVHIVRVATAGTYVDRVGRAREPLRRVIDDGQDGGAVARSIDALFLLAIDDFFCGAWDHLLEITDEGLRLCAELGYVVSSGTGKFLRGLVAAARGDGAAADGLSEEVLMFAAPRRLLVLAHYASHIRCLHALGTSTFGDAYRHAALINPPGDFLPHNPHALWLVLDLTEAAARSGRFEDARAHARGAKAAALEELSPRLAMLVAAAQAVAHPDKAREHFEEALAVPGTERYLFDRARIELLYGEQLRRDRATTEARTHLSTAATLFAELGAEPWVRRTQSELRATGENSPSPGPAALTAREQAVAELAATGLTNKQIGEQLYLSDRTVSTHLYRIFHKLGVTRRSALRDALERHPGSDPAAH